MLTTSEIALLSRFKDHKDPGVREGLVSALLAFNKKAATDTLIFLSNDRYSRIRDWANFGIGSQIDAYRQNLSISNEMINDRR